MEGFDENEDDYDEFDEENFDLSLFEIEKLKNPLFVEKIKNAINTNIEHGEVTNLKILFTIFVCCLVVLSVINYIEVSAEFSQLAGYSDTNMKWVRDQFYINELIHLTFNSS
jgi:hypothetical protein